LSGLGGLLGGLFSATDRNSNSGSGSEPDADDDASSMPFQGTSIVDLLAGAADILSGVGNLISGAGSFLSGMPDLSALITGELSPEIIDEIEKGVQTFAVEYIKIIDWLKANAPKAIIIINTVHNPIPHELFNISLGMSQVAENYIERINMVIVEEGMARGCLVTDIHAHLSNRLDLTGFNLNPAAGDVSIDLIHPNAAGHELIAQLNYATLNAWDRE